ncbi:ABC transporter permease [Alkalibacterium sp. MB6]|uniref:ABC transporter permease n=1 Tax=Alkalibacterium sp. MB6 TaxID=2081965 RepID=UPI001379F7C5|nr:ABC transporter permease [Alkalibacterium sp. MB6]
MWTIFKHQWLRLFRQPTLVMTFLGLTILFVYFMGGSQGASQITVSTFSDELPTEEVNEWLDTLNEDETFLFVEAEGEQVIDQLRMNEIPFALELKEDSYRFISGREDAELSTLVQYVEDVYATEMRIQAVKESGMIQSFEWLPIIELNTSARTETASTNQAYRVAVLVGMTLYFVIYSIFYLMENILEEKIMGTWNRLIFSPVSKTKIYTGQLLHYFLAGLFQIALSFLILSYLTGIDLGHNWLSILVVVSCFTFAIVALGMLLMGIVQTTQQLQVLIPIVATAQAMLGGAFWPLEIVSNPILLFLSDLMPIKYGIQGMMGAVIQERSLTQLGEPIGALLLMGVLFMGIGMNLMERVTEKRSI